MSDELARRNESSRASRRNLATWEEGEGYRSLQLRDFDAGERALANDLRTLLEITKTALESVTIDVPGPSRVAAVRSRELSRRANGHGQDPGPSRHARMGAAWRFA